MGLLQGGKPAAVSDPSGFGWGEGGTGETAVLSLLPRGQGGCNWAMALCRGGLHRWGPSEPTSSLVLLDDFLTSCLGSPTSVCALRWSPWITPGNTPAWGPHVVLGNISLYAAIEEVQITSKWFFPHSAHRQGQFCHSLSPFQHPPACLPSLMLSQGLFGVPPQAWVSKKDAQSFLPWRDTQLSAKVSSSLKRLEEGGHLMLVELAWILPFTSLV